MSAADALRGNASTPRQRQRPASWRTPSPGLHLTPREQEIRQLLAQRLTNQEISQVLGISVRTAEHHVGQLLAKLGVANRRQVAPVVIRPSQTQANLVSNPEG